VRELPKSLEYERSILGALILEPEMMSDVEIEMESDDFSHSNHSNLYKLLQRLYKEQKHLDLVSLCQYIGETESGDLYGGFTYVSSLPDYCATSVNISYYAREVRKRSIRRRLIQSAQKLENLANDPTMDVDELIEKGQQDLLTVSGLQRDKVWQDGESLVSAAHTKWIERQKRFSDGASNGLTTGFNDLDRLLCGMETGLYLLAARPSMGKTALALNMAISVLRQDIPVAFFSLEMDSQQLMDRLAACLSGIDSQRIRSGDLSDDDWDKLETDAMNFIHSAPLFVQDRAGITVSEIHAMARRIKVKNPNLGIVIVDYLQLIKTGESETQEQSVSALSLAMKTMSRELDLPVLCLAQLNRSCESRDSKRPKLSDLRGSGSLEQDADAVMFLFREAYYRPEKDETLAEISVKKHRNGPTGSVMLHWNKEQQRFSNWVEPMRSHRDGYSPPMNSWGD
jgi:replicative DNA helicase